MRDLDAEFEELRSRVRPLVKGLPGAEIRRRARVRQRRGAVAAAAVGCGLVAGVVVVGMPSGDGVITPVQTPSLSDGPSASRTSSPTASAAPTVPGDRLVHARDGWSAENDRLLTGAFPDCTTQVPGWLTRPIRGVKVEHKLVSANTKTWATHAEQILVADSAQTARKQIDRIAEGIRACRSHDEAQFDTAPRAIGAQAWSFYYSSDVGHSYTVQYTTVARQGRVIVIYLDAHSPDRSRTVPPNQNQQDAQEMIDRLKDLGF